MHVACRTEEKAQAAAQKSGAAGAFACDLSSLESVRGFVDAWGGKPIDTLCLNAGAWLSGLFGGGWLRTVRLADESSQNDHVQY